MWAMLLADACIQMKELEKQSVLSDEIKCSEELLKVESCLWKNGPDSRCKLTYCSFIPRSNAHGRSVPVLHRLLRSAAGVSQ